MCAESIKGLVVTKGNVFFVAANTELRITSASKLHLYRTGVNIQQIFTSFLSSNARPYSLILGELVKPASWFMPYVTVNLDYSTSSCSLVYEIIVYWVTSLLLKER